MSSNDETSDPINQQSYMFSSLISKIDIDHQGGRDHSLTQSPKRAFLYKRAASQLALSQINRQEDTPETYLTPLTSTRINPTIKIDQSLYKCLPQTQQKYKGIFYDHNGKVIKRQILGNEQVFRQVDLKHKNMIDLKSMISRSITNKIGLVRNKTTTNMNEYYNSQKGNANGEDQRDFLSVKSRTLHTSKTVNNNAVTEIPHFASSNQLSQIDTQSKQSRSVSKNNRFIKFPDYNAQETVHTLLDRVSNNQESLIHNLTSNNNTLMSTVSKVSTLGGLLKEIQQERNLRKQNTRQKDWVYQATKLNQRIFTDQKLKQSSSRLKTQNEGRFQSVMMRDRDFIDRMQFVKATSRLEEVQNINQNVGWIFQLRQSKFDNKRNSQQYLPSNNNINAVIIPKDKEVDELQCKQDFSSDEEEIQQDTIDRMPLLQDLNFTDRDTMLKYQDLSQRTMTMDASHRGLQRISSEPQFTKWQEAWKKNGQDLKKVMLGTTLKDIKGLKIRGANVLKREIGHCMRIPTEQRVYMLNHYYTPEGEGEPNDREEVFAEYYDKKYGY